MQISNDALYWNKIFNLFINYFKYILRSYFLTIFLNYLPSLTSYSIYCPFIFFAIKKLYCIHSIPKSIFVNVKLGLRSLCIFFISPARCKKRNWTFSWNYFLLNNLIFNIIRLKNNFYFDGRMAIIFTTSKRTSSPNIYSCKNI